MRTILVTGASSGIGREVARRLLGQGHTVIGTSREPQKFRPDMPGFVAMGLDLANLLTVERWAKQLSDDYPGLDGVVFAAGYGRFGALEQMSIQQIEQLMTVNFTAQACLTRWLLPQLKQKQHANLVYIGSEAALSGSRNGSIYCASKFALRGFTQALREECGRTGVRVSLVNPGMVDTPFFDQLAFRPGSAPAQALQVQDVADAVCFVLNAGRYCGLDEINLSPLTKVVSFKK